MNPLFDLEAKISEWRAQMAAAGMTDRATLVELESHVRDDYERARAAGFSPEASFAAAAANLGPAGAIKEEFELAVPRSPGRIAALFPTNMRIPAIAAIAWGGFLFLWFATNLAKHPAVFADFFPSSIRASYSPTVAGYYYALIAANRLLGPVFDVLGILGAVGYLGRRSQRNALLLALFWCGCGFPSLWGFLSTMIWISLFGHPLGEIHLWGLRWYPLLFSTFGPTALILGGFAYFHWRRAILGSEPEKQPGPDRQTA